MEFKPSKDSKKSSADSPSTFREKLRAVENIYHQPTIQPMTTLDWIGDDDSFSGDYVPIGTDYPEQTAEWNNIGQSTNQQLEGDDDSFADFDEWPLPPQLAVRYNSATERVELPLQGRLGEYDELVFPTHLNTANARYKSTERIMPTNKSKLKWTQRRVCLLIFFILLFSTFLLSLLLVLAARTSVSGDIYEPDSLIKGKTEFLKIICTQNTGNSHF
jgi:hypothetical protein